ncbi:hypothetical protein [Phytohabitans rumicis]|uniref:CBM6 domain-containing protein n=1 Tax=Phytohabitans rumicis TaxID=1076125 RepID=A0A6V8KUD6_9ACTN|nr:hypothetical protein [Phytohabitans rumicis]GFJ88682.1 hypothetical protein Prum_023240 [Phytohabitans rumicis]
MDQTGNEKTAELRIGGWLPPMGPGDVPTQALPRVVDESVTELIPIVTTQPADVPAHGESRLPRPARWALVTAAVAALASVPIALFATSDSAPSQNEVLAPQWPVPPTVLAPESSAPPPPDTGVPGGQPGPAGSGPARSNAAGTEPRTTTSATPSPSASVQAPISYEAEAPENRLRGQAARRGHGGASGGQVVGWVGGRRENTLRFGDIKAAQAGQYQVTIFYIAGERRYATVEVNGDFATVAEFPAVRDWVSVGSYTITLTLKAGDNTIQFGHPYAWTPDLDRIIVAPRP